MKIELIKEKYNMANGGSVDLDGLKNAQWLIRNYKLEGIKLNLDAIGRSVSGVKLSFR